MGRVAMQVNLLEEQKVTPVSPLQEQEKKKRPRRNEGGIDATNNTIRSVLSFEESDREQ